MNTSDVGDIAEAAVLAALLRTGRHVLIPFGNNHRYDLVIDDGGGKFLRVQCKTGRLKNGAIVFKASSIHSHRGHVRRDYTGQAELFGVFVPEIAKVYVVPVNDVPRSEVSLRLVAPSNGNKNYRFASNYELK